MGEHRIFRSLTMKLTAVVIVALICGGVTLFLGTVLGQSMVEDVFMSGEAVRERLTLEITSFRNFVSAGRVRSTDVYAIGQWNREHRHTQLTIFGTNTTVNSSFRGAELVGNDIGLVIRDEELDRSAVEFPVNFDDGVYSVAVYDNSHQVYYGAVTIGALAVAVVVFLGIILLYDRYITKTILTLSRQVRQVGQGDLQMQIKPMTHDEIGELAMDVDAMRLSIIDKLQREEEAWQANAQLITAVSHDVRTPLTAMMGYLELLGEEGLDPDAQRAYLEICKNNAQRLKSLTDELFGFFLVFGKPAPDQNPEEFDAGTLIDQILMEQEMILAQQEFQVELVLEGDLTGTLYVDLGHLRRVFDNLFSNVNKYADREKPVVLRRAVENGELCVTIQNHIALNTRRAESNRIGLQTCHKLVAAMGGEFSQHRTEELFIAEVVLPLKQ